MLVAEVMTAPATTIDASATLADVLSMMSRRGVRHLPVLSGDRLVGLISDRDLKRAVASLATAGGLPNIQALLGQTLASRMMSTPVHHREEPGPVVGPDATQHLEAVDLGKLQVEQHDLGEELRRLAGPGPCLEEIVERFGLVTHDDDLVPDIGPAQRAEGERLVVGIVFHDEDHPAVVRHVWPLRVTQSVK
jgi:CBS domain-containing protein